MRGQHFMRTGSKVVTAKLDASRLPHEVLEWLGSSHPEMSLSTSRDDGPVATIEVEAWSSGRSLLEFDRRAHEAKDRARGGTRDIVLRITSAERPQPLLAESCVQILTRYQRLF